MRSMEIDRRTLCRAIGAGLLLPSLSSVARADAEGALFAAAYRNESGLYGAAVFDEKGRIAQRVDLPSRGHGFAVHRPSSCVVAFARRPGRFAVAVDHSGKNSPAWFAPPQGRHFYGHGIFSNDGRILFTSENRIDSGQGLVGLYDATNGFKPLGVFGSGGIGPHDLALMPDGNTLAVANGGIRTHPDMGREPLNIEDMKPSLAYIDMRTGDLIDRVSLAPGLHKLSLRHLAVNTQGLVVIGCQHKGPRHETPGLVITHRTGAEPMEFALPDEATKALKNYVSSVAADASGQYAAVTSSKGGIALVLDLGSRRLVKRQRMRDVSGVTPMSRTGKSFFATAGTGAIGRIGAGPHKPGERLAWDNHVILAK